MACTSTLCKSATWNDSTKLLNVAAQFSSKCLKRMAEKCLIWKEKKATVKDWMTFPKAFFSSCPWLYYLFLILPVTDDLFS